MVAVRKHLKIKKLIYKDEGSSYIISYIPSTIPELKAYNSMINGGLPVHFHHSHIVDPPFFFMMVFKLARPIFPKEFFDNQIMHKRSDGLDEFHKSLDKECFAN